MCMCVLCVCVCVYRHCYFNNFNSHINLFIIIGLTQIILLTVCTENAIFVPSKLDSALFLFPSKNNLCILWRDPDQSILLSVQSFQSSRQ